jgi:hypothetical protein
MTEPESGCSTETPARTPLRQTTRALRLSALLRIQRSTSWRGVTGSENSSIAPFRDRFRTRQSMVEDRLLNTIRRARYVRCLSLLRCSFILRSLFGTARGFYLWFSNGRANIKLLTTTRTAFHDERFTPRPRKPYIRVNRTILTACRPLPVFPDQRTLPPAIALQRPTCAGSWGFRRLPCVGVWRYARLASAPQLREEHAARRRRWRQL